MFDAVAQGYDLTNTVLSAGQDWAWRVATRRALALVPGERVLDLAAGTGVSAASLAQAGAQVVGCDFSLGMLRRGAESEAADWVDFVAGDALALPFADNAFDATTISFGLRNVVDVPAALAELHRVTRPGGRLVICEFSRPVLAPVRALYYRYLGSILPAVARLVSSNPAAYTYLAESIEAWPDQTSLAALLHQAHWRDVAYMNLSGGIVALHRATK
jgi:demethylmenaquinone methyltransferase/2-methoxy-6-polyprenyl-1,4-benzoquinol methylase